MNNKSNIIFFIIMIVLGLGVINVSQNVKRYDYELNIVREYQGALANYRNDYSVESLSRIQNLNMLTASFDIKWSRNLGCFNNYNCSKNYESVHQELSNVISFMENRVFKLSSLKNTLTLFFFSISITFLLVVIMRKNIKIGRYEYLMGDRVNIRALVEELRRRELSVESRCADEESFTESIEYHLILNIKEYVDNIIISEEDGEFIYNIKLKRNIPIDKRIMNKNFKFIESDLSEKAA